MTALVRQRLDAVLGLSVIGGLCALVGGSAALGAAMFCRLVGP